MSSMTPSSTGSYSGYTELYTHPNTYDDTFVGGSEGEVEFYTAFVKKAKKVLYLGSGSGRLMKAFLKVNKNVTGVEIQKEMVVASRKLLPKANILHADALKLDLQEKFDLVVAPYLFTSHFEPKQATTLFQVIGKHLEKNGKFVGDMFSPYLPHDRTIKGEVDDISIEGSLVTKIYCLYDHEEQICTEFVEKTDMKSGKYSMVSIPWHYYYPEQLKRMMKKSGMRATTWYGTFLKDPLTRETPELVWVSKKI